MWHLSVLKKKVKWSRYRPDVAQRVGTGIALLFHDRGTRRGWVVSSTLRPHFTPGKNSVPILQEAGWAPGPVWTGDICLYCINRGKLRRTPFAPVKRWTEVRTGQFSFTTVYVYGTSENFHLCFGMRAQIVNGLWTEVVFCNTFHSIDCILLLHVIRFGD